MKRKRNIHPLTLRLSRCGLLWLMALALLSACGGKRSVVQSRSAVDSLVSLLHFDTVSHWLPQPLSGKLRFKYDNYFLEAMCQKEKGNFDAELMLLDRALSLNPDADEAWYEKPWPLRVPAPKYPIRCACRWWSARWDWLPRTTTTRKYWPECIWTKAICPRPLHCMNG